MLYNVAMMIQRKKNRIQMILGWVLGILTSAFKMAVAWLPVARTRIAPGYRRLKRGLIVTLGFSAFICAELILAKAINNNMLYLMGAILAVLTALVVVVAYPTWGFICWLFLSPFAKYFLRVFTVYKIGFDIILLGSLLVVVLLRALMHRTRPSKLILAEWLLIGSFIYSTIIRNTASLTTPDILSQLVLAPLVLYFIAKSVITKREHILYFVVILILTGISWAILGIYEQYAGKSWLSPLVGADVQAFGESMGQGHRSVGPAGHYYLYGNGIILSILLALHWGGWAKKQGVRVLCYTICPILLMGLYYGYTRAPYLAFLLAITLMLVLSKRSSKRYLLFVVVIFTAVGVLIPHWMSNSTLRNRLEKQSARSGMAETSLNMFWAHPYFGIGSYKYLEFVPKYASPKHVYQKYRAGSVMGYWARPHSEYYLVLAEQGIIGFVLYFGCIFAFLTQMFRIRRRLNSDGGLGKEFASVVIAFTCGVLLTMITDEFQGWLLMYAMLFIMFAVVLRLDALVAQEKSSNDRLENIDRTDNSRLKSIC